MAGEAGSNRARLGYVVPGLGHLLRGDVKSGVAYLAYVAVLLWAAVAGFPRLDALLFPSARSGGFQLHPWVAVLSWLVAVGLCWWAAHRYACPTTIHRDDRTQWDDVRRQFAKSAVGVIGLHLVGLLMLVALLTPLLAPHDPIALDIGPHLSPPSWAHPLGTDEYGRDLLSRVFYGARISLTIGFVAVALSATIGTAVGALAGYFGGTLDHALMWLVDLLLSLPRLVLLLAIIGIFRTTGAASIFLVVTILGATGWMGVSRIVRAQFLSLKEQDFVQAARALGASSSRLMTQHLLPNSLAPVIVFITLTIGSTILVEASLSFLGLGVPPPTPTWGAVVNEGREHMRSAPWITIFPGLMIVVAVTAFNLLGDGLRDALDPKLRGR